MAKRPIYIPLKDGTVGVNVMEIEFKWFPGMSIKQKQKSIRSLHSAAEARGISPILEISSKSQIELGGKLSAFNLQITTKKSKKTFSVESAFQGSKVFQHGGPFIDLLDKTSREAKKDPRLKESGRLLGFCFFGREFSPKPRTFFYDWLYLNALKLKQNSALAEQILTYSGFTDIEFNPSKSINCQAYSAALFVTLYSSSLLGDAMASPKSFLDTLKDVYQKRDVNFQIQDKLI
jgi:hypothetical protein